MKSLLVNSIIGGVLLAVLYIVADRFHFPLFPINIVVIPGGMMFTINGFLRPIANRGQYSYFVGVGLSFIYGICTFGLCYIWFSMFGFAAPHDYPSENIITRISYVIGLHFPLILITSFLVPLMYLKSTKDNKETEPDILDADL